MAGALIASAVTAGIFAWAPWEEGEDGYCVQLATWHSQVAPYFSKAAEPGALTDDVEATFEYWYGAGEVVLPVGGSDEELELYTALSELMDRNEVMLTQGADVQRFRVGSDPSGNSIEFTLAWRTAEDELSATILDVNGRLRDVNTRLSSVCGLPQLEIYS